MSEPDLVETVFEVADKSSTTLAKIAKEGKETQKALDKAKESADAFSRTSVGSAAAAAGEKKHGGGRGGGSGMRVPFWMKELPEEEREELLATRKEYQIRRMRAQSEQLEMQKEQAIHHAADIALLMTGSESSKLAQGLSKAAAMSQTVGPSMVGLGGSLGTFGKTLSSLGGYMAFAGVAFEALSFIDENTGHHIEHAGEAAWNWTQHLFGVTNTTLDLEKAEVEAAKSLGYRSAAEMKAFEAAEESAFKQRGLTEDMQEHLRHITTMPTDKNSFQGMQSWDEMIDAARETAQKFNLNPEQTNELIKQYQEAMEHTAGAVAEHAARERQLTVIEQVAAEKLASIPLNANEQQVRAHTDQLKSVVGDLVTSGKVLSEEAEAVTKEIEERYAHADTLATMTDQYEERAHSEALVDQAVKEYMHGLPKLGKTMASIDEFHSSVATLTRLAAQEHGFNPEQSKDFMQKLEKANHNFDFRGSHFDIHQDYKDIDPERIATAFTTDLAAVGERRVQSSFAPLFSI